MIVINLFNCLEVNEAFQLGFMLVWEVEGNKSIHIFIKTHKVLCHPDARPLSAPTADGSGDQQRGKTIGMCHTDRLGTN